MERYLENFKNCLQKEIPYCAAECPFHFEMLPFIEKMRRSDFNSAFKSYRNAVGFPKIVSELCAAPCKGVCPRKDTDNAIDLPLLEKACIDYTVNTNPTDYNLPIKEKKIAIIGAGISGLACALRLCMKKYTVEIFEVQDRIGGNLWNLMPSELFLADIEQQFQYEKYELHLNRFISSADELSKTGLAEAGFDAVYVATGQNGRDFGLLSATNDQGDKYCMQHGDTGWFAGGELIGAEPIYALADGLFMGTVIDNYLKTGNLLYPKNVQNTGMCLDASNLKYEEPVLPSFHRGDGSLAFSKEEAEKEANRCMECQCYSCRIYCDLTDFYNKWPLRIRDEIIATTLPGSAEVKATPARRLLSTCNQCGLCKETCPEDIDVGGLILAGRGSMHKQKKAPWVFHDFWLRDMDFADGESCSIVKAPEGYDKCTYAFFPGCQLPASEPGLVEKTYQYLLGKQPDMGLMMRCCGVPAEWAGDEERYQAKLQDIREEWESFGRPTLVLACPTCEKKFKEHLPEISVTSLYQMMAQQEAQNPLGQEAQKPLECELQKPLECEEQKPLERELQKPLECAPNPVYSVFDPCASRHETETKEAVRTLARNAGFSLEPLPENDAHARCCSFGGQPGVANPEYVEFVVNKRIAESNNPYITYCINCRDTFLAGGKKSVHILQIIFGDEIEVDHLPTISERRDNRATLKRKLMVKYWGEEMPDNRKTDSIQLRNSSEIKSTSYRSIFRRTVSRKTLRTYGYARLSVPCTVKKYPRESAHFISEKLLIIPEEVAKKLSDERILEEDVLNVIAFCEQNNKKVLNSETGTFSGYRQIGFMTYWVEYRLQGESIEVVNAYSHRVKIELEEVWNGIKTDLEVQ